MTQTSTLDRPAANPGQPPSPGLDEVLLTMDAVDAIRHEQSSVAKDLSEEDRRAELVRRVREQYAAQGIPVSDAVIEEAIRAGMEQRYVFTPPEPSLQLRLARAYATRRGWGRKAAFGVGIALVVGTGGVGAVSYVEHAKLSHQAEAEAAAARAETAATAAAKAQADYVSRELPARISAMVATVDREAKDQEPKTKAEAFAQAARNALATGDVSRTRAELAAADRMIEELRAAYEIRIVTRAKEASGIWRIPRDNPSARNYYLVVEAIGPNGPIPRRIRNEETGNVDTVVKWGVRVPDEVFDAVKRDKQDDGIISNRLVGVKESGRLSIDWRMSVRDGAVTKWEPAPGSGNR